MMCDRSWVLCLGWDQPLSGPCKIITATIYCLLKRKEKLSQSKLAHLKKQNKIKTNIQKIKIKTKTKKSVSLPVCYKHVMVPQLVLLESLTSCHQHDWVP